MELVRKRKDELFSSSQVEFDVNIAAAHNSVLEKNAGVKFNYHKWTWLNMTRSVFNWTAFN